jgi:capsular polysaccharide biosynthesis protein
VDGGRVVSSSWHIEDEVAGGREPELAALAGGMVSLAFIRATMRRLWMVWVGTAEVGAALALCWLTLFAPQSVGTVTLLLAHDPSTPPDAAMATDVSLLKTRAVAQRVGSQLGLQASPDALLSSIQAEPTTSSVLQIDIVGTNPDDAVRRARLLGDTYLAYRKEQLTEQSTAITQAYRKRMDALQLQVDDLTRQYDEITARGDGSEQAADVLASRGQLIAEITGLENQIETESLEANAVVAASRVLDQASLVPQSPHRRAVLVLASGVIAGLGLGLGVVMVYAITTGRLRSRADVAAAMGKPVRFSAGEVIPRRRRRVRRHRRASPRQQAALDLLVDGLETAVPRTGMRPRRLGLISIDCEREGAKVLAGLARRLSSEGSVLAVDLAATRLLARELEPTGSQVSGQQGSVAVVSGPTVDTVADVLLSLVPFEFGRGLGHVRAMTSRCVVLVKTGRSTSEQLNTVARSARAAGLDIEFVMLVGADKSDASFGGETAVENVMPGP